MADFITDADPYIPSGVPATPEQVAVLVAEGTLPADKVADLHPDQQPEDLQVAVAEAVELKVAEGALKEDFTEVLAQVDSVVSDVQLEQ